MPPVAPARRSRNARPSARSDPRASSKRTLSSKWRGRDGVAPIPDTRARASEGPGMRSLTSLSMMLANERLFDDADGHLDAVVRIVALVARRAHDLVGDFHPAHDAAEGRVLAVEEAGVLDHDEELAARAVRALRAGHGEDAPLVRRVVELRLQARAAGAAGAVGGARRLLVLGVGVAALDHEPGDHAVE